MCFIFRFDVDTYHIIITTCIWSRSERELDKVGFDGLSQRFEGYFVARARRLDPGLA